MGIDLLPDQFLHILERGLVPADLVQRVRDSFPCLPRERQARGLALVHLVLMRQVPEAGRKGNETNVFPRPLVAETFTLRTEVSVQSDHHVLAMPRVVEMIPEQRLPFHRRQFHTGGGVTYLGQFQRGNTAGDFIAPRHPTSPPRINVAPPSSTGAVDAPPNAVCRTGPRTRRAGS